jgi:hypothetical protein
MKLLSPRLFVLPALLLLTTFLPARADNVWQYAGSQWGLLDSAKVMAAAADITLAKYPDSDDATVEEKIVEG